MTDNLKKLISDIPGEDGFWHSDAQESLEKVAEKLIGCGVSENDTIDAITSVFSIAANEYGN